MLKSSIAKQVVNGAIKRVNPAKARKARKRAAGRSQSRALAANPVGGLSSILESAGLAFGSYAVTRFVSRVAFVQLSPKYPKLAPHLHTLSSLASTVATYYAAQHIEALKPYDEELVIGSVIASAQSVVQHYLPKFGWIVSDVAADPGLSVVGRGRRRGVAAGGPVTRVGGRIDPVDAAIDAAEAVAERVNGGGASMPTDPDELHAEFMEQADADNLEGGDLIDEALDAYDEQQEGYAN